MQESGSWSQNLHSFSLSTNWFLTNLYKPFQTDIPWALRLAIDGTWFWWSHQSAYFFHTYLIAKLRTALLIKKHRPSDAMLNRGPDSLWSLKIPECPSKKSRGVTPASWPNFPIGLWPSWTPNHPIHWLAPSLCLLSTNKLVCGGRSGAIWLPSHHPGGCCTLVVDEEIPPPPYYVVHSECLEKCYIEGKNYTNYYYNNISAIHQNFGSSNILIWCQTNRIVKFKRTAFMSKYLLTLYITFFVTFEQFNPSLQNKRINLFSLKLLNNSASYALFVYL